MKNQKMKIFLTIFAISMVHFLHAQMIYVPDPGFRYYLNTHGYANCMAGDSIDSGCPAVMNATALPIFGNFGIQNIDGIQAFSNLDSLAITQNPITNFPTLPSSLIFLNISGNSLTA